MEVDKKNPVLKHLGFVRIAALKTVVLVSNIYNYGKQNSGPLRSTVGSVEEAVSTVVGPVYERFKGVPDDLLVFLDHKVNEAAHKFDKHAPPAAKKTVNGAQFLIHKATEKAQELVKQYQSGGPRAALHFAATGSKNLAATGSIKLLVKLNQYPSFHKVAHVAAPTAANFSEKYNHLVKNLTHKGSVFGYLPLIPVEQIARALKKGEAEKEDATPRKAGSDSSDSD